MGGWVYSALRRGQNHRAPRPFSERDQRIRYGATRSCCAENFGDISVSRGADSAQPLALVQPNFAGGQEMIVSKQVKRRPLRQASSILASKEPPDEQ